jgi:DNA-binding CsgD family transcriptional regulator
MSDGCVITFYSYKGGVGRSFLLANVAATLSRWGYRVLCVDFDLEAPGLSHYFAGWAQSEEASAQIGDDRPAQGTSDYGLTPRERDVLALLLHGHANKEIAVNLNIAEGTVKTLLTNAYRKIGVTDRAAALRTLVKVPVSKAHTEFGRDPRVENLPVENTDRDSESLPDAAIEPTHAGLLELVEASDRGDDVKLDDFLTHVELPDPHVPLALLAAGRRDGSYMTRVQQLDWARLYAHSNLGAKFERIRAAWTSRFDFVLIDSRTGVSDTGGICTAQLPDILLSVFCPKPAEPRRYRRSGDQIGRAAQ